MIEQKITPLMQQYFQIKSQYENAILLFQVGDFYELFFDDAKIISKFLNIALTSRGKNNGENIPLCGIPVHALNHYLIKLVRGGFKVVICDQLTKPTPGKVVERGVTQVFTPGTLTDSSMLDEKSASYIVSVFPNPKNYGLIFTELLTAQLFATTIPIKEIKILESELARYNPDEIILPKIKSNNSYFSYFKNLGYFAAESEYIPNDHNFDSSKLWLEKQFNEQTIKTLLNYPEIGYSLHTLYFYLKKNQEKSLDQFNKINFYKPDDYLILDSATLKNLEILKNNQDSGRKNSLLEILDKAKTPMGSRQIKKWLSRPLISKEKITERSKVVTEFCKNINFMQQIEEILSNINDLERIAGRIALNRANRIDYLSLKQSLILIPNLNILLLNYKNLDYIQKITAKFYDFSPLINLIESSINEDISGEWIIKKGFDLYLDRLRSLVQDSQKEILKLEQQEISKTGISSLKIRYNNISGYYIEITNPNLNSVPQYYQEQQKLVNRKRFTTQELKNLEQEIFKAQNEIDIVQTEVFNRVKEEVGTYLNQLRNLAQSISWLDAIFSFAKIAYENNYTTPVFNDNNEIFIKSGRHPVVEQKLENNFEPNDTSLNNKENLWIITGPNMGGKSTYLRQVALICIMAQCGSLIPAQMANMPILDRIFTRIGSGDNLAQGKSTFLVEMEEAATICTQATKNSLVILDEVGRGTSTFDGIALAQSIIEHINQNLGAKCLFATHYHELTELEKIFPTIANYHMLSKKINDTVIFLHKIAPGIADSSFGIEVAKLANLPTKLITRANEILNTIKTEHSPYKNIKFNESKNIFSNQTSVFDLNKKEHDAKINALLDKIIILENKLKEKESEIVSIKNLNLDELSPKQVFDFIWKIKNKES
ncbi:DNA mismatch repair protein MutS [Candidatus Dependentiae bacterium]|nr:DNA mismatch repair protein MutS [Candidatus Dependentiae bacterium]